MDQGLLTCRADGKTDAAMRNAPVAFGQDGAFSECRAYRKAQEEKRQRR